ncbi:MAG: saccharopine dehydrogenase NADP-binding domain-containing protein, partial [Acidimicrobiales bacterium]
MLGATGYTGRLSAAVLERRGVDAVLGGRDQGRLDALPGSLPRQRVDTTDGGALATFLDGVDAVISTVGPFNVLGRAVADAAARTHTGYVDSTGEMAFMSWLFATHAAATVPMVPACGMDYVPGDLAVALASEAVGGPGAVTSVRVGYRMQGMAATRGTARSAVGEITQHRWTPRRLPVAFPDGRRDAVEFPWGEALLVPRRSPQADVRCGMVVPAPAVSALAAAAPVVSRAQPLLRAAAPWLERLVDRRPDGPDEATRAGARFTVAATVDGRHGDRAGVVVEGRDVYGLTAELHVACALRLSDAPPGAR